jgi:hypothetical protein
MKSGPRLVRFIPRTEEWSRFAGWEGMAAPSMEPEYWTVNWKYGVEGMPSHIHEQHLSFKIRKFSRRFA